MKKSFYITLILTVVTVLAIALIVFLSQEEKIYTAENIQEETQNVIRYDYNGLPIYPGAEEMASNSVQTKILVVNDTVQEVASFYFSMFTDYGWVVKSTPEDPSSQIEQNFTVEKLNKAFNIEITADNGKTLIQIYPDVVEDNSVYEVDTEDIVVSIEENTNVPADLGLSED